MKKAKDRHQGMRQCKGRCCFTILNSLFLILFLCSSNAAFAACLATITATTPTADFVDNADGTVTHTKTGLMWKQCSEGLSGANCTTGAATTPTWTGALLWVKNLNAGAGFATFHDWRVPNIKELHSIIENQCYIPTINAVIFPNTVATNYWSASPVAATGNGSSAWSVSFWNGRDYSYGKGNSYHVRLVRGGQ